ncbi:hypothetical protein SAMN05444008_114138 [Cnuella takakiae]|uniref:Uncharacterized protein n=1 Tax=Cnuella takakiae TaxID=1302690 RepID=A0A1M5FSD6_9BACT|nr:hypothetical protein [Cnuella takakiae]OLY93652.1 hypothetical protein BUE76_18535 [Cnuella takakiae]SHF94408.1 hypothetical protein SAMN05444008_114138 [Cnuella takakiae]
MTATQYYFPYFFQLDTFNKELASFGLLSSVTYDEKAQMLESLLLKKQTSKDPLLSIPFGATIMLERNKLFYWKTDTNLIDIVQVDLFSLNEEPELLNAKIDLSHLQLGKNHVKSYLDVGLLVTYVRKENLTYNKDYFENFVIVIIEQEQINLIPFDWFNKTGGDYGYVWPALARLDTGKLYGQGMRMANFTVDLD